MSLFSFLANLFRTHPSSSLLSGINSLRSRQGLTILVWNPSLEAIALSHSQVMTKHQSLSHDQLPDGTPQDRLVGIPWSRQGEVIALSPDLQTTLSLWEKSPPHLKILTGPFTQLGAAHTDSYWCAILIS